MSACSTASQMRGDVGGSPVEIAELDQGDGMRRVRTVVAKAPAPEVEGGEGQTASLAEAVDGEPGA